MSLIILLCDSTCLLTRAMLMSRWGLFMRVLAILPGSGGSFYCQNCLRDLAMAEALRQRGHTVTVMSLYLPASETQGQAHEVPVFYGAVTLYLRYRYAFLRRFPHAWFRPLDSWPVLRLAARFAGSTSASTTSG